MCGIFGFKTPGGTPADQSLLKELTSRISHRGPDAQGEYIHENFGLGHRRLSVIDLSEHANQPMISNDQKVILAFNGEIYNFKVLREKLINLGHKFTTSSDTEVILNGYLEWDLDIIPMLNGMFAFAILDTREENQLIIARDRAGIKPLFYAHKDQNFTFASELKPIYGLDWVKKEISKENLFYFLKHGHIPTPGTIVNSIEQLPPGQYAILKNNNLTFHRFWHPSKLNQNNLIFDEGKAIANIDQALKEATKDQIVSDVPIGCFLSGGIDSSLLVSYFSELRSDQIKTFSIGYKEAEFDESSYAKIVADQYKTDHHEIIVSAKDLLDVIPSIPQFYDQPFSDPTLMPTMLLSKFAREFVTVALSGDGGDELFYGYEFQDILYRLDFIKDLPHEMRFLFFETMRKLTSLFPGSIPLKLQQIRKFFEILQFKNREELLQYFIGTIGPLRMDRVADLIDYQGSTTPDIYFELAKLINENDWMTVIEQTFFQTFMLDTVLSKTDRASMAHSLEVRVPFLDNRVIEAASRTPHGLKFKNKVKKYPLRKLLSTKLPKEIVDRKKQGFSIPLREWLRGELKELVFETLNNQELKESEFFNQKNVNTLIEDHMKSRANNSHLIWSMMTFQMWRKHYNI